MAGRAANHTLTIYSFGDAADWSMAGQRGNVSTANSAPLDDGTVQTLDSETHGRSDAWKQNVLSNTARQSIRLPLLAAGPHNVRVFALDPGFLLDRIEVRRDGAAARYGAPLVR